MKQLVLTLFALACTAAAVAQTSAKPATAAKHAVVHSTASGSRLPPGVPPVRGVVRTAFALRYQDIKIGAGPEAEPDRIYKILYTGWLAADGRKFDSTDDHPRPPVLGKDGKPVLGANGKPEKGPPEPFSFAQGFGRVIPGFDQGFHGMRIGGKRRLFIPWQLAYGARGRPGPNATHPGIPPKADLIFDVELVGVSDMMMPPNHGMMPGIHMIPGGHPATAAPGRSTAPAQGSNSKPN